MTIKEEIASVLDNYIVMRLLTNSENYQISYKISNGKANEYFILSRDDTNISYLIKYNEEFEIIVFSYSTRFYHSISTILENKSPKLFEKLEIILIPSRYSGNSSPYIGVSQIKLNGIEEFKEFLIYLDEII
ncbi:hypothetical protein D3C76_00680 [compost metagenome]